MFSFSISVVLGLFLNIHSVLKIPPQKIIRGVEIWGIRRPGIISVWREISMSTGKYCRRY
jgi:hypothetical protein